MNKRHRANVTGLGSATALDALVQITAAVQAGSPAPGVLARDLSAMLGQLQRKEAAAALEGFCDELQGFIECAPTDAGGSLILHLDRKRRAAR